MIGGKGTNDKARSNDAKSPSADTFVYDEAKQTLVNSTLGTRVMVLDAEFYQALNENLTQVFKSGAQVFLYQMGLAYGDLLGRRILRMGQGVSSNPSAYLERYSSLAMGKFEFPPIASIIQQPNSPVRIRLRDSFFARSLGKTGQAECHIVRGLLEGTAKSFLKTDLVCSEEKCISKGDELCEFLLTPAAKRAETPAQKR